jgi:hypothetical protein
MSIFERLPFDGEPIGKPPPSAPTADPTAPLVKWHRELFGMGVAFDVLIVGICLYSLFLSAVEEDHAPLFVLVIQAAFAFAELGRAPLAYAARVLSSAAWRNGCAAGVIVLGFVTAFNLFMPFNQGLRDRLVRVQEAKAELEAAKAENATFQVGYEKALKDKADAENRVKDDTARTTGASADYAKTPRICGKGGHCHADRELGKNLADARIDKKADRDDLTAAKKTLNGMNPKTTSDKVLAKEAALHRAFNKNSVFGAVATILGVDPANISENGTSWALRLMTIPFCLVVGLLGSLICLASVERLPRPEAEKTPDDENTIKISGAGMAEFGEAVSEYGQTLRGAEDVLRDDSATPEHPAPAKVEPPAVNTKAKRTQKNAAIDGRTRRGKAAKRKAKNGAANNVLTFPNRQDIIDDDIQF